MLSDNLKNGTKKLNIRYLYFLLVCLFMVQHLVHGLLLSKLVSIPKNTRGNKSYSSNYRTIALNSLQLLTWQNI